ncbi:MAG: Ribosomal RNA small subunit methyltransferase I [Candidatus Dichloromethanomonas elyunquensis]|nr:MAG: Ribosomal RNA small subunit methyltransferase I [Candidatus Dichloromethanomonas elyunquensis]
MQENGTLYVCATPIGNLGDITLRVIETLKQVDFIAAEDTRHSRKLLNYYHINTPLISYHQHNEKFRTNEVMKRLKAGENCALISDAGMPGISDPGQVLINTCLAENIKIDVLPGPNAAVTALVLSGMPTESFIYLGFLPSASGERKKILSNISELPYTSIFYEAPHRIIRTLEDIQEVLGDRLTVVARELTKVHQSIHKGLTGELLDEFRMTAPKGECCILIGPYIQKKETGQPMDWLEEIKKLELEGKESKEAMKIVAKKRGISKRDIYKAKLES